MVVEETVAAAVAVVDSVTVADAEEDVVDSVIVEAVVVHVEEDVEELAEELVEEDAAGELSTICDSKKERYADYAPSGGDRGGRGGGRGGLGAKGGSRYVLEPHRHAGVFVARGKEDLLVTKNLVPVCASSPNFHYLYLETQANTTFLG